MGAARCATRKDAVSSMVQNPAPHPTSRLKDMGVLEEGFVDRFLFCCGHQSASIFQFAALITNASHPTSGAYRPYR